MFRHQQLLSLDPARFVQKEKQLRDYHLRNWLTMNRSKKELLELCLNHFYGEHPKLLRWCLDIIDGDPKGLVVASIVRESKSNAAQAEIIFEQLQSRVSQCRILVDEVSRNSALSSSESRRLLQDRVRAANSVPMHSQVLIVQRPTMITACAILLFMSTALTILFVVAEFPGMGKFQEMIGMPGLYFSIAFSILCAFGYWNMKKWSVFAYAVDPIARFLLGMPHSLIAIPLLIAAIGLMHLKEMTWK